MTHELKTHPPYWDAIYAGTKNFEVRRDDRGFQTGDELLLIRHDGLYRRPRVEYNAVGLPPRETYEIRRRIKYILTGGQLGIEPGYVVMALEEPQSVLTPPEKNA